MFWGGWTLAAAEAVCGPHVLEPLGMLVNRSLVLPATADDDEPRFAMLETIHAYARERLDASEDLVAVADAHAAYVGSLVEHAQAELHGADQQRWIRRLSVEEANIRAALRWLLQSRQHAAAAELVYHLTWFWWLRGYAAEGRRWGEDLLASHRARAAGLTIAGELDSARARYKESLLLSRAGPPESLLADHAILER